jgi:succinyl-diaminopimelate desuccinylase
VKALEKAVREVYKVEPKVQGIGGGTVAAFFRRLNLPAVVYSRLNETAHQPNEYCILDNLIGDAKVFALSALILGEK